MITPDVRTFSSLDRLSEASATEIVAMSHSSITARGRFTIALAGGNTPRRTYELLATTHRAAIDWERVHVVFGDERMVPYDDPRNNYRMAREALLSRVPIPAANVHAVPTDPPSADEAAARYDATLRAVLTDHVSKAGDSPGAFGTVDLALLGVGPDGHTASLFPESPALDERERWALGVPPPTTAQPSVPRVTATFPFLDAARAVIFLVAGADKRPVVREILDRIPSARRYPAARVAPRGRLVWMLDALAAGSE